MATLGLCKCRCGLGFLDEPDFLAGHRLRLQLLLEFQHDHLPPDAPQSGRRGDGRDLSRGGRSRAELRTADATGGDAARAAASAVAPNGRAAGAAAASTPGPSRPAPTP